MVLGDGTRLVITVPARPSFPPDDLLVLQPKASQYIIKLPKDGPSEVTHPKNLIRPGGRKKRPTRNDAACPGRTAAAALKGHQIREKNPTLFESSNGIILETKHTQTRIKVLVKLG